MSSGKPSAAIMMNQREYDLLEHTSKKRTVARHHRERLQILVRASVQGGGQSNVSIGSELNICTKTVKKWRTRWTSQYAALSVYSLGVDGEGISDSVLIAKILSNLEDAPRIGAPKTFTLAQEQQIVALACQKPCEYGIEMTTWTHVMLAHVATTRGIVPSISSRHVGTFLKKKPVATP